MKGKTHTYYQVLIDARDCPHISQRSQTEAVTFLANHDDSRALYAIPGLDYVSHEDILPYTSTDQVPIQHELFERFLLYDQTKGTLSHKGKLEWEGPFFKDSVTEAVSKLFLQLDLTSL